MATSRFGGIAVEEQPVSRFGGVTVEPAFGERALGTLEAAATIGSSAIAEPLAGLAGIGAALIPGGQTGGEAVESVRQALTFQPGEQGQQQLQAVGEVLQPVGEAIQAAETGLGDFAFELTGSPEIAAAATSLPTLAGELLGLGILKKVRRGTKLLDDAGRPTLALEKALDKQGLTFDNLSDAAKSQIPNIAEPKLLPGPVTSGPAEKALIQQIKSGARDNSLATLQVVNNKVQVDRLGAEAVKQGFDEGFVQAVKTANPATRRGMSKMLDITRRIKKNRRLGLDIRPTHVVGDSVSKRIKFIRDSANDARNELNDIAKTQLKGQPLQVQPILNKLEESLDALDVKLVGDGVPTPDFKGSLISKDRTSQRVIKDLIDLMGEGGEPDALRFHKMKRQLDNMIDFRKKSAAGLSEAGRNVLKDLRSELNNSIREVNPDYARVNDTLSQSLTALDNFKEVSGKSIDIFGKGSSDAIGQDLRGLMSNRKSRVKLENAVNSIDDTAKALGGKFDDDIKDLALFANSIEDRFGAIAQTSFKGEIESAITQAGTQGVTATLGGKAIEAGAKGAEKLRGINDFNAFKVMADILERR